MTESTYTYAHYLTPLKTLQQTTKNYLYKSKSKTFAGGKINVTQKLKFCLESEGNSVDKAENAGYQHFFLFFLSLGVVKCLCCVTTRERTLNLINKGIDYLSTSHCHLFHLL